jgi:serine/threonine-protein kinase
MSNPAKADGPSDSQHAFAQRAETLAYIEGAGETGSTSSPVRATKGDNPLESSRRPSLVGQSFGDLELLAELGRGGMGIVFKARQKSLERLVAVKLLLTEYAQDPVRLARFYAEARAAASLDHTNIVQIYQVGECAVGHYFAMEYVDGRSLEYIIANKRISIESAAAVTAVVADAVHYAHTKGIVHRDLKPANIMIDQTRRPVVMDFGIVKFVGQSSSLTQQGVVMGTPAYMAPEQAGDTADRVGPHSDVYSLGAILYSMLTAKPPYEEQTALRTILKVIGPNMPPSPRSLQPHVPRPLDDICMRCLNKDPDQRFESAKELAEALRAFRATGSFAKGQATLPRAKAMPTLETELPRVYLVASATRKAIKVTPPRAIVGRTSECDIIVRASDVSKQHCQIIIEGDTVLVEDLGSANGTFVNDEQVERAPLTHKDRLRVADHEFIVRFAKRRSEEDV